jgi:hypothetical protein
MSVFGQFGRISRIEQMFKRIGEMTLRVEHRILIRIKKTSTQH